MLLLLRLTAIVLYQKIHQHRNIQNLPIKTNISKNLFAREYIETINYSPETIKIALKYKENSDEIALPNSSAAPNQKSAVLPHPYRDQSVLNTDRRFVPYSIARNV